MNSLETPLKNITILLGLFEIEFLCIYAGNSLKYWREKSSFCELKHLEKGIV